MPFSDAATATASSAKSAKALTLAAYASFVPIGIATVLLGPMLPILSTRWSLNYSQAGRLFPTQYIASTVAVALSGVLVSRWGFRFAIKAGLVLATAGVGLLLAGPETLGMACIAAYGGGLGLAVPAANLLVAEVNPGRRSATLNLLNFCWSAGSVASPFLVAAAAKRDEIPLLLACIAGFLLLVALGIAAMPSSIIEPSVAREAKPSRGLGIDWKNPALPNLAALFFIYVGTENGFGLWVATYAKSLGSLSITTALMTPSFFYSALLAGRLLAPLLLRLTNEVRLAQAGLLVACAGMGGLLFSHALPGVLLSACLAGFGLSIVYPIAVALLSLEFGASAARVGSLLFTLSNLGGGLLPWIVGVSSTRFGTLRAGLIMPLIGSGLMYVLYLRKWKTEPGV
ncbi:MAG TPA: MFS transporter [Candidatus Sulfotelmatobacter sp.]|jgi:fucose permease